MNGKALHLACGITVLLLAGCGKTAPSINTGIPAEETLRAKPAALSYAVKEYSWKVGDPSVSLIRTDTGVCFLSLVSGNFEGFGEKVGVHPGKDGFWHLEGKGQQEGIAAKAVSISSITPAVFGSGVKQYEWTNGQAPVRMLNKNEGVCFLSGLSGRFAGYGEEVRVRLADDGYWYLGGQSGQADLKAKAIGIEWTASGAAGVEIKEHSWSVGKPAVKLLRKEEGFCFLASVSGVLAGSGEQLRVYLADDGYWYLAGQSGQDALSARAIAVRVPTR